MVPEPPASASLNHPNAQSIPSKLPPTRRIPVRVVATDTLTKPGQLPIQFTEQRDDRSSGNLQLAASPNASMIL